MRLFILIVISLTSYFSIFSQTKDLSYFLEHAKRNSPLLFHSYIVKQSLFLEAQRTKAHYSKPTISLESEWFWAPIINHDQHLLQLVTNDAKNYTGYDLSISDGGQYRTVLHIEQPLFNGKKTKIIQQHLTTTQAKAQNDSLIHLTDLTRLVTFQYLRCLQAQREINYQKSILNIVKRQQTLTKQLVENGLYKPSDLQRLSIEVTHYHSQLQQAISHFKQALFDLNILCGLNDTSTYILQEIHFTLSDSVNTEAMLLKQFELDSLLLLQQQAVSDLQYHPQLSAFADGGLNAVYLPSFNRLGIAFGLKFSWLLFDGKQQLLSHQKTTLALQDLSFRKHHFLAKRLLRLQKIKKQLMDIDMQLSLKRQEQKKYEQLLAIYNIELSQGNVSILNLTSTIREMVSLNHDIMFLDFKKQVLINAYTHQTD